VTMIRWPNDLGHAQSYTCSNPANRSPITYVLPVGLYWLGCEVHECFSGGVGFPWQGGWSLSLL
jgi:hypothetical protein